MIDEEVGSKVTRYDMFSEVAHLDDSLVVNNDEHFILLMLREHHLTHAARWLYLPIHPSVTASPPPLPYIILLERGLADDARINEIVL